jgi:hypothetical protein
LEPICQNPSGYWLECNDNIEDNGLLVIFVPIVKVFFHHTQGGKQSI